jgi:hypothetical protein
VARKNIHAVDRGRIPFVDVLVSADAVLSKPGYGIVSDCVVNRKPLIYAERTDTLEYPILEEAIKKFLKHIHIRAANLYRGEMRPYLEAIWNEPEAVYPCPQGGAEIAARRIMRFIEAPV